MTEVNTSQAKGTLYLIPNLLGETNLSGSLPADVQEVVKRLRHFIVEDEKSARKFLKICGHMPPYDQVQFYHLDKYTSLDDKIRILKAIMHTEAGLLSEAGCPAVADPGSELVQLAHQAGISVRPLVGPSSILLALMASGGNGQGFSFHGYLPVQPLARQQRLRELENQARQNGYTQLFIETPFRGEHMLADLIKVCQPGTWVSVAIELTQPREEIYSRTVAEWRKTQPLPDLKNRPAVFSLWIEKEVERHKKPKYEKNYRDRTR